TVLTHDASDVELRTGDRLRRGRELLATGRCFRCHTREGPVSVELMRDAPALVNLEARIDPDWLVAWLADPRGVRPDAQMPRLLPWRRRGRGVRGGSQLIGALHRPIGPGRQSGPWQAVCLGPWLWPLPRRASPGRWPESSYP